jgi:hypothetical protein
MKLTKNKVVELYIALNSVGHLSGVKFAYAVSRNIAILKPEIESIQAAEKPREAFQQYDKERIELAEKHAKKVNGLAQTIVSGKRKDGSPLLEYVIENRQLFDTELMALKEKHKAAIDERERQEEEFESLLKDETEVDLYKIQLKDVPQAITTRQMTGIYLLIADEPKDAS